MTFYGLQAVLKVLLALKRGEAVAPEALDDALAWCERERQILLARSTRAWDNLHREFMG